MTKIKYREIKGVIKTCKRCGKQWSPQSVYKKCLLDLNLCEDCRKPYYRECWKKYTISLTLKQKERMKKICKNTLARWVKRNPERRREQALESYHRNKNKPRNKRRKHRATGKKGLVY